MLETWRFQGNVRKFWNPTWFPSPNKKVVECRHVSTGRGLRHYLTGKDADPDRGSDLPMPTQLCDSRVSTVPQVSPLPALFGLQPI